MAICMYIGNSSSFEYSELAGAHSRVAMKDPEIDEDEQDESEEDEQESVDESDQHSSRSTHDIGKLLDFATSSFQMTASRTCSMYGTQKHPRWMKLSFMIADVD